MLSSVLENIMRKDVFSLVGTSIGVLGIIGIVNFITKKYCVIDELKRHNEEEYDESQETNSIQEATLRELEYHKNVLEIKKNELTEVLQRITELKKQLLKLELNYSE